MARNIRNKKKNNRKNKKEKNILDVYTEDNNERERGNFEGVEDLEVDSDDQQNIDLEDDEEIDEDEAFNSEDEAKYGDFFPVRFFFF